jgi:hypothetical protein
VSALREAQKIFERGAAALLSVTAGAARDHVSDGVRATAREGRRVLAVKRSGCESALLPAVDAAAVMVTDDVPPFVQGQRDISRAAPASVFRRPCVRGTFAVALNPQTRGGSIPICVRTMLPPLAFQVDGAICQTPKLPPHPLNDFVGVVILPASLSLRLDVFQVVAPMLGTHRRAVREVGRVHARPAFRPASARPAPVNGKRSQGLPTSAPATALPLHARKIVYV